MNLFRFFLFLIIGLQACTGSQKIISQQNNADAAEVAEKDTRLVREQGTNFTATGSIPVNWNLRMNYDDTVKFTADDGLSLSFAYHRLKKEISKDVTTLRVELPGGKFTILITEKECTVPTVRETFSKQVTVSFNKNEYTGCGKLLADAGLNHSWVLEKMGTTIIRTEDYSRLPVFTIDPANGSLSGNDGCNNINGKIEVQGNRIQFSPVASTKRGCNKKDISIPISENISGKLVYYFIKEGKLYFSLPDDSIWIFKKG